MYFNLISLLVAMMAAVCFYVGLYYLWMYLRMREKKKKMAFALICFAITMYDIFCVGLYNAESIIQGIFWQRLQFASLALLCSAFSIFTYYLTGKKNRLLFTIICLYFLIFLVLGFSMNNTYTLTNENPMLKTVKLGNLIDITYYEADPGLLYILQYISMMAGFIFILYLAVVDLRSGNWRILPILIALVFFFLAALNDVLVGMAVYSFIYLLEYTFLFIILSMSYLLLNKFIDLHDEVKDFNARLEVQVEERTEQLQSTLISLADANKKLEELSSIDGLTGVSNRRIFDERFEIEWRRSLRSKTPLSLFILDLDFFKKVNDDYGHQAGDICLKEVGQILRRFARRPGDLVARYGGEEFSVILSNTPSYGAVNISEGIIKEIESRDFSFEGKNFNLTASIGIASCIPDVNEQSSSLITAADHALYEAKENGRNRVSVYISSL